MHKGGSDSGDRLRSIIEHLAHLLPAQGPIGVFIHHNTLHAFQHLPFEKAVVQASALYGTEPYMSEDAYRAECKRGRIQAEDIRAALDAEPDAPVVPGLTRRQLRHAMLIPGVRPLDAQGLEWQIEEGELFRGQEESRDLFEVCLDRLGAHAPFTVTRPRRPRDGLLPIAGTDLDEIIHPLLIRLSAVFTDQGMSYWPMPERERGFYVAARGLLGQPGAVYGSHLQELGREFRRQASRNMAAEDAIASALEAFGAGPDEWEPMLRAELLALPGWAGLMRRLEEEPDLAPHERIPGSLMDFLAVRLTMTLVAAASISGNDLELWRLGRVSRAANLRLDAARLFDAAELVGFDSARIRSLSPAAFERFREEVASFHEVERRRVFHVAYELRHEHLVLAPLARYRQSIDPDKPLTPAAQVFFCIDEREESIRRQLEEFDPGIETFGAAGFFGVAVNYKGIDDPHGVDLCPVVVDPQHAVLERPREEDHHLHRRRLERRKSWAALARGLFVGSRTLVRGWVATGVLGLLSLFPLIARVLSPLQYGRLRERLNRGIWPEPRTELTFMRDTEASHQASEGLLVGFSTQEKIDRVASVLGPAGLTRNFSRLVVILGHGSTSLNNPHESAHDCGACGGRRGGPNARLFATMANRPGVRAGLVARGILIPDDTWFVGGYHDTCNDAVDLYDLDAVPSTHRELLARVRRSLDGARALNALERSRRFEAANGADSPAAALLHVEERAEHLAEPRPEYGHATNAVCIVGRRSVTRGLFLDRRAFLVSYDATLDPDDGNLARVLGAVVPVCGGISLEYYFSFVDNERYGCGTKLPHNVTGLVGVMNGHASDLRTGLPWQMVEVHEPVRILFVVETTPERLMKVVHGNPQLAEFVENRWVRVAAMDPENGQIRVYRNGTFHEVAPSGQELPMAADSVSWFRGKLEHLPLARIGA